MGYIRAEMSEQTHLNVSTYIYFRKKLEHLVIVNEGVTDVMPVTLPCYLHMDMLQISAICLLNEESIPDMMLILW